MADTITLTQDHLKKMGLSDSQISTWYQPLKAAVEKYQINTGLRLSGFFANALNETGNFTVFTENLNYSANRLVQVFPKYFPNINSTNGYAGNPKAIANKIYGGRMGNGIESTGDGYSFRGRGIFQLTGKSNYHDCSRGIGIDVLNSPDNLLDPTNSSMSAAWFFSSKGCNSYSDSDDIVGMRKRVNGGTIGLSHVTTLYENCKIIFGVKPGDVNPNAFSHAQTPLSKKSSFNESTGSGGAGGPTLSGANSEYPWNWVWESRSHHIFEVDDTPGAERIQMMHRTGSYSEINPLGTRIDKSVLDWYSFTKGDFYKWIGGVLTVKVEGQGFYKYGGDVVISTDGDMYLESSDRIQMNAPIVAARELITVPELTFDRATVNDIIAGWIYNSKYADRAASLGGTPLPVDAENVDSISAPSSPAIEVAQDNSSVTINTPTTMTQPVTMNSPLQFSQGTSTTAPTEGNAIAVMADTASPTGYALCYSVAGVWYRSYNNTILT